MAGDIGDVGSALEGEFEAEGFKEGARSARESFRALKLGLLRGSGSQQDLIKLYLEKARSQSSDMILHLVLGQTYSS